MTLEQPTDSPMDLDNASDCASVGGEQAAGILLRFKIGRKRARTLKAIRSLRSLRCLKSSKSSKYSHSVSVSTCVTLFTKKSKPWHGIRSGCTNNRTETNRITSGRSEQWQTSLFLTHLFRQAPLLHFVKKEMKRLILAFIILFSQRILYRWCF